MPETKLSPYENEPCYVCGLKITHLHQHKIIPKEISKTYFPAEIYGICKSTKIYTCCDECGNCFIKFYEKYVVKEICSQFNVDLKKINALRECKKIAKSIIKRPTLLNEHEEDFSKRILAGTGKQIDEVDFEELSKMEAKSWQEIVGSMVTTIDSSLRLINIVMSVIAKNKDAITNYVSIKSQTKNTENTENIENVPDEELFTICRTGDKNVVTNMRRKYAEENKRKMHEEKMKAQQNRSIILKQAHIDRTKIRQEAERNFKKTGDFESFYKVLNKEMDDVMAEYIESMSYETSQTEIERLRLEMNKKLSKIKDYITDEKYRHKCFSEGKFEEWKQHHLAGKDKFRKRKSNHTIPDTEGLNAFIEYAKKVYSTKENNTKEKEHNVLCAEIIPTSKRKLDEAISCNEMKELEYSNNIVVPFKIQKCFERN